MTPDEPRGPGPTAVEAFRADFKQLNVVYQNSVVKIRDRERTATSVTVSSSPALASYRWMLAEASSQMAHLLHKSTALHLILPCLS